MYLRSSDLVHRESVDGGFAKISEWSKLLLIVITDITDITAMAFPKNIFEYREGCINQGPCRLHHLLAVCCSLLQFVHIMVSTLGERFLVWPVHDVFFFSGWVVPGFPVVASAPGFGVFVAGHHQSAGWRPSYMPFAICHAWVLG